MDDPFVNRMAMHLAAGSLVGLQMSVMAVAGMRVAGVQMSDDDFGALSETLAKEFKDLPRKSFDLAEAMQVEREKRHRCV